MAAKLVSSRQMLRLAAHLLETGHPAATAHCAMAKKLVTDYGTCNSCVINNDCKQGMIILSQSILM
jgi:hypothetical protein